MDYKNGKIYTIRSYQTDDLYIGSTTQTLTKRLSTHKSNFKRWKNGKYSYTSSYDIIKYGDAYIELLELFPCSCKMELCRREGELIRSMDCLNKRIAGRTDKEYRDENKDKLKEYREENKDKTKEYDKEYYQENKDKRKEQQKEYCEANKDKLKIKKREYREANKDKIKDKLKEYYEANKEKLKIQAKKYYEANKEQSKEYSQANKERLNHKINCECGGKYTYKNKSTHFKSQKHQAHVSLNIFLQD